MIKARIRSQCENSNLGDYERLYRSFSWDKFSQQLQKDQNGRINLVGSAIDLWADNPKTADQIALIVEKSGDIRRFSYQDLKEISCQWANMLSGLGYCSGDRLFVLLPQGPEIYFAMLACARLGVVFCILHSKADFNQLEASLANGKPKGILTHPDFLERLPSESLASVKHFLLTQGPPVAKSGHEVVISEIIKSLPKRCEPKYHSPKTPLYIVYTSGSTGPPKGVVHSHGDSVGIKASAYYALDLHPGDILWTDGDPGWITGTVYSSFAPWLCGAASVVQADPFSASTWYRTLERHKVNVWYTSPMILRKLVAAGEDLPGRYDFSKLRHIASVGEPLTPELFFWCRNNLNHPPHDTWWMSETGMILVANFCTMDIKLTSIGRPLPGVETAVVDENGDPLPFLTMGELAVRPNWPAMASGLWQDQERYQDYFRQEGWFLTGDMAVTDEDGYIYLQGRNDDLIKVEDKFIGPYEVEQIIARHPSVNEAAVISRTPVEGPVTMKAFVTVHSDVPPSSRLNLEIKAYVKANLSPDIPLKDVEFMKDLPKTSTGKLIRRALRAKELGVPTGDTMNMTD
jgi:acetyl-CoA synthetase